VTVILHIGTEKTGTTSIQKSLYQNRNILMQHGYYFVQTPGKTNNRALVAYCMRDDRYDDFLKNNKIDNVEKKIEWKSRFYEFFKDEILNIPKNIHTVIITSEHFHSRTIYTDELLSLRNILENFFDNIKIIIYLRRQVDTAISLYSTALKAGFDYELESSVINGCKPSNPYYNYYELLEKWNKVFSNVEYNVRLFDKKEFYNGDLIKDFYYIINNDLISSIDMKVDVENESTDPLGQCLLRSINHVFKQRSQSEELKNLWNWLSSEISLKFKGKGKSLSLQIMKSVQERFYESNKKLCRKYFPDRNRLFDEVKEVTINALSNDQEKLIEEIINSLAELSNKNIFEEKFVDLLRDSAILLEETDLSKAYALMSYANRLRPYGQWIKNKLNDYKNRIKA